MIENKRLEALLTRWRSFVNCSGTDPDEKELAREVDRLRSVIANWEARCGPWFPWDSRARKRLADAEREAQGLREERDNDRRDVLEGKYGTYAQMVEELKKMKGNYPLTTYNGERL